MAPSGLRPFIPTARRMVQSNRCAASQCAATRGACLRKVSMIADFGDLSPRLAPEAYVAPGAMVLGAVSLGRGTSIWFNAVVRADNDEIVIGDETNIQDLAMVHTDAGIPMRIGRGVTVGHKAVLHGCSVGDGSLIGINAVILNRAQIGEECLIGAGALVTEGKIVPPRSLVLGQPGKVVRELTSEEINSLKASAAHYAAKAQEFRARLVVRKGSS